MVDKPMVKVTLGATIPTRIQYENIQPIVEVQAETFEEAAQIALNQIASFADLVRENKPMIINELTPHADQAVKLEQLADMEGNIVFMDRTAHTYQDKDGKPYLSGSTFAHKFVQEFPKDKISGAMASKYGVEQEDIVKMWETNAEASTSLGTAIHAALELYGKYQETSRQTKEGSLDSVTHKNPLLKAVQRIFYEGREHEEAIYEAFISIASPKGLCGFIDRLLIVDASKKIARVQDYKTNPDINKAKTILEPFKDKIESTELGAYWLQLSFYAYILSFYGWTIQGLDIFNIVAREQEDNSLKIEMETYSHDVIDITPGL